MKTWKCETCGDPVHALKIHGRWEEDPYCSTACAKRAHGVDFTDARAVSMEYAIPAGAARDPMLR